MDKANAIASNPEPLDVIELRELPIDEAKTLILTYLKDYPGSWTGDIAEALGIDYIITNEALYALKQEGILVSRDE